MRKALKLGFVGGSITSAVGYAHFVACKMDGRWNLEAGCFSRNTECNYQSGKIYGVEEKHLHANWKDMLKSERDNLDAVAVLLPTPSHFEIVKKCIDSGIPVICEKTLAMNYAETKKIADVCEKNNAFLVVTYNYSGYPIVRELRNLIKNNVLGKILHFQAEMPQESFIRVNDKGEKLVPQDWRLQDKKVPTMYLDLGSHLHHLIYYLIGEKPLEAAALHSSNGWFSEIVDNVSCIAAYSNDIQGQFWLSKSALGNRNGLRVRIYGSLASAEWVQAFPEEITLAFNDGTKKIIDRGGKTDIAGQSRYNRFKAGHPAGFVEAFANLYNDIADALILYKENKNWKSDEVFGAELAGEGLRFLEAVATSAVSKRWEKV